MGGRDPGALCCEGAVAWELHPANELRLGAGAGSPASWKELHPGPHRTFVLCHASWGKSRFDIYFLTKEIEHLFEI